MILSWDWVSWLVRSRPCQEAEDDPRPHRESAGAAPTDGPSAPGEGKRYGDNQDGPRSECLCAIISDPVSGIHEGTDSPTLDIAEASASAEQIPVRERAVSREPSSNADATWYPSMYVRPATRAYVTMTSPDAVRVASICLINLPPAQAALASRVLNRS